MSEKKLLLAQMCFLEDMGFKVKSKSKNSENEILFSKNNLIIEFLFDTYSSRMDVVIDIYKKRTNIFDCEIFDKGELVLLRERINAVDKMYNLNQQFIIYGEFIKKHIQQLNIS